MARPTIESLSPQASQAPQRPNRLAAVLLKSWRPNITWGSTILFYFISGFASLVYGLFISHINNGIIEVSAQYDQVCGNSPQCSVTITVPTTMKAPVYLYYGIDNFYQNHRLYIQSHNPTQLAGTEITLEQAQATCISAVTNQDLGVTESWNKVPLDPNAVASPCGLIAKSYFTGIFLMVPEGLNIKDSFELWKDAQNIPLDESNIAWPNDIGIRWKQTPNSANTQWINPENEHFVVWMRTAILPDFRKLWAYVDQDLAPGDYHIDINNKYDVTGFEGKKYVILTTADIMGGKNDFLASTFFALGAMFMILSMFFAAKSRNN